MTRVACVGFGAIGSPIANALLASDQFSLAGVVDPARAGESLDDLTVSASLSDLDPGDIDVAVLATSSQVSVIAPQVLELLERGHDVVSTAEELTYPWLSGAASANDIDVAARSAGKTVVGTGVNPGFLMDLLPVALGGVTIAPRHVRVTRYADLAKRRSKLSEKLGVGLDVGDWESQGGREKFGHVGLLESAYLCAAGMGGRPDAATFERTPVCDGTKVIGVHELAEVQLGDERGVSLELSFSVGSRDEDVIEIDGDERLRMVLDGGVQGDTGTIARVLHTVRMVGGMRSGLRLPLEIPAWSPA
jgi:4-hydroxy-tetrahydrodipicolinate reductase